MSFPLDTVLLSLIGYQTWNYMCPILRNNIKTQSLVIWEIQVHQIYYYTYYSVGVHVHLMNRNKLYLWFCTIQAWFVNIIILFDFQIKKIRKTNHNEILNNIPHFIKNRLHVDCLQGGFVMYNNKVILHKR